MEGCDFFFVLISCVTEYYSFKPNVTSHMFSLRYGRLGHCKEVANSRTSGCGF